MSCEIRTEDGKLLGILSDSLDEQDILFINGKRYNRSEVYKNKELKDEFNKGLVEIKDA